jgi:hypothetical protein
MHVNTVLTSLVAYVAAAALLTLTGGAFVAFGLGLALESWGAAIRLPIAQSI